MFKADLLKNKRIIVTSGGTGIGKAMARQFLELGAEVAITDNNPEILEKAAQALASIGPVSTFVLDISSATEVDRVIGEIWSGGSVHALVNNADEPFVSRTEELSPTGFDEIANNALHGTFYATNAVGRRWIAEGSKGSVLSIVATWAWTGSPYVTASAMSKAAIASMTQGLAVEWGPKGIRLNAIAPGVFLNEDVSGSNQNGGGPLETDSTPLRRKGRYSELANLATFLLADGCDYVTGEVIAIDGGQWLNGAGTFARYASLSSEDWKSIRSQSWKGADKKST
ncbi:SDR family oxidoreductase [Caballeronia sp. SEWSISQ10-4 2]|uniref:SDR family oxidoreductase n=1 Tax=Caballeronia sp. SEWSISQ10-4 2 TaxID=2937438 RepID=UPI00264B0107|nr:SDR family oxidoreductase [Caballeronia sp. SEWSISQ10-4 2]MDN7177089.1 SDR family oxidoreductase [Caballeronia sp. SEWSISQ10-4 2]